MTLAAVRRDLRPIGVWLDRAHALSVAGALASFATALIFPSICLAQCDERPWSIGGLSDRGADAYAVSGDGTTIVGRASPPVGEVRAFRWTSFGGIEDLGTLGGDYAEAYAVSADGSVVVGGSERTPNGFDPAVFRWEDGVMQDLGTLGGNRGYGTGVSADGSVIVGYADPPGGGWHAFRWEDCVMEDLGTLGGSYSQALAVSADGLVVVGYAQNADGDNRAFRWTEGDGMQDLGVLGGDSSTATAVSADGSVIVGWSDLSGGGTGGFHWTADRGMEQLDHLNPTYESTAAWGVSADGSIIVGSSANADRQARAVRWTGNGGPEDLGLLDEDERSYANGVSAEGGVIVGVSLAPGTAQDAVAWGLIDSDGDGIPDCWEIDGIPYLDGGGNELYYLLDVDGDGQSDADPHHKDLFIEVDVMTNVLFSEAAIDAVVRAFADGDVNNPDGTAGVNLHVLVDDLDVPFRNTFRYKIRGDFDGTKREYFGTELERFVADQDDSDLLDAKAKAFRYCLWVNRFDEDDVGGTAETPGNDFMVGFAALPPEKQTTYDMAVVFMHEIGHNLGLRHGGLDEVNYKPNHVSVMNYGFTLYRDKFGKQLRLDYCRDPAAELDESHLNETVGYNSPHYYNYRTQFSTSQGLKWVWLDGRATNWNGSGDETEQDVEADLNVLGPEPEMGLELLRVANEWQGLQFQIGTDGAFKDWQVELLPDDELDAETYEWLDDNSAPPICGADFNEDGTVNTLDVLAFLNAWNANDLGADANGDGMINTLDVLEFLNLWNAGC